MLLKKHWYIAAFRRDVTDKPQRRIIAGEPVVLFRDHKGAVVALEDRCPHREVPLSMGAIQPDGTLQCLYHGLRFDRFGKCMFIPEQTHIPEGSSVKSYSTIERGEWIWIFLGEPEKADASSAPSYPWFSRPGWKARTERLYVKCNYKLLVDNLLNMAHLPYVHPRTIGSEGVISNAEMNVERRGNGVRLSRRMFDIEPPPTYKKAGGFEGNVNRWQTIDFMAPSFFEFDTGVIDVEYPIPENTDPDFLPKNAKVLSRHSMHGVVPETEATSNYYVGFAYDPATMSEETVDFVFRSVIATFKEDVEILEAQQANMAFFPNEKRVHIVSDAAGMQAMRIISQLERDEIQV